MQEMSHSIWLTIDLGNSAIKSGLFCGDQLLSVTSAPSIELLSVQLASWSAQHSIDRIGLSSVVPEHSRILVSEIQKFTDSAILTIDSHVTLPLKLNYAPAKTLGADRIAAACAAWYPGGDPHIVIDAGTAITIDAVSSEGTFLGGVILPGPTLGNRALATYTAKLPDVTLTRPDGAIGNSTIEALQYGLMYGMIDGVSGMIKRIKNAIGGTPVITLTGGWSNLLADHIPEVAVRKNLVLHGIRLIMELNKETDQASFLGINKELNK